MQLYIYHADWAKELREWLSGWMDVEDVRVFFDYLVDRDEKHYAVSAPGVPTGYRFKIPGMGSFVTDKTPFKKGTMEFEIDPGFPKMLKDINRSIRVLSDNQVVVSQNMEKFGVGMDQHMKLIEALQSVAVSLQEVVTKLDSSVDKLLRERD